MAGNILMVDEHMHDLDDSTCKRSELRITAGILSQSLLRHRCTAELKLKVLLLPASCKKSESGKNKLSQASVTGTIETAIYIGNG
jgi:hypothetical protein